jgi:hypothetical protein
VQSVVPYFYEMFADYFSFLKYFKVNKEIDLSLIGLRASVCKIFPPRKFFV